MRRRLRRVLIYAAAIAVLAAFLLPIAWVVEISFKTRAQIFVWPPRVLDFAPTLENYRVLFQPGSGFVRALGNSVMVALSSTAIALALALPASYALAGRRLRHAATLGWGILLFRMMPPIALLLPYYLLFRELGLLGSLAAITIAHVVFSFAIIAWMMRAAFESLPGEIEEAARIDGASNFQVFARIALPLTKASIAASAIFAMLTSWNEFLFAVTLSRPQTQTVPVAVSGFVGDVYVSWGQLAAATVIGILPALALAFAGQRWLLAGMAPGAVK